MVRGITEEDIQYCRDALQKAKVMKYPYSAIYLDNYYTVHEDGTVDVVPLSEANVTLYAPSWENQWVPELDDE